MITELLLSLGITGAVAAAVELGLFALAIKEGYDLTLGRNKA